MPQPSRAGSPVCPASAEAAILRLGSGAEIEGWELPLVRIRELEIHHVDLDAGYSVTDWSDAFAMRTLDQVAPGFAARPDMPFGRLETLDGSAWRIGAADTSLTGPPQELLGWLLGRSGGSGLRPRGRNEIPAAPPWA